MVNDLQSIKVRVTLKMLTVILLPIPVEFQSRLAWILEERILQNMTVRV